MGPQGFLTKGYNVVSRVIKSNEEAVSDVIDYTGTPSAKFSFVSMNFSGDDGNASFLADAAEIYIYDRTEVRVIFIALYTIVFCFCVFGNLMVILVVTMSRRLRSTTNFFLANLAGADLCVGIFCIFQNLTIYLIPSWVFGEFLCKMYMFVNSLSYTASIFILVVICTERYFAIVHPIRCKQILTPTRLRVVIGLVWLTSLVYSSPRFFYVKTINNELPGGRNETICILPRTKYNSKLFDIVNFVLLYLCPLSVMTVLYSLIAVRLWNSSLSQSTTRKINRNLMLRRSCGGAVKEKPLDRPLNIADSRISLNNDGSQVLLQTKRRSGGSTSYRVSSSRNVLRARRGVVRMLIIVVLTFALCNLPFHARKMWQYWSTDYVGSSIFSSLLTPLTFLVTYCNSAINPLLYAFLSRNFQKGIKELWMCNCRKGMRRSWPGTGNSSLYRKSSTRSMTHLNQERINDR